MAKLRFDPVTYQFYCRCSREEGAPASAAGFRWDPLRRRYYSEDPKVAVAFASSGDSYVRHLLADVLESEISQKRRVRMRGPQNWAAEFGSMPAASSLIQ
jgi:hypothetical protein